MSSKTSTSRHKTSSKTVPASPADVAECTKKGCKSKTAGDWTTLNSAGAKIACAKNCASVKANCELTKEDITEEEKKKTENKKLSSTRKKRISILRSKGKISDAEAKKANDIDKKNEDKANKKNLTWKHKHCKDLIIKPSIQGFKKSF